MKEQRRRNTLQYSLAQIANAVPTSKKDLKENWGNLPRPLDSQKDLLLNMYNKSMQFQNCFQTWKQSTLDPGHIDPSRFAEEKTLKLQEAMQNNIVHKKQLLDTFKGSLTVAKEEYQKMVTEKKDLEKLIKQQSENTSKEQQTLRIKIIKLEELLKNETNKLTEIEKEYEETKKSKLEIIQAGNAILEEIAQDLTGLQQEKQSVEEYLEKMHAENMAILKDTIRPLEETGEEIARQKKVLQERMTVMQGLINETTEEQNMLVEDLNSHLFQRAEYVAQREELDFLHEQLEAELTEDFSFYLESLRHGGKCKEYETAKEKSYYLELVQKIIEGVAKHKINSEIEIAIKNVTEVIRSEKSKSEQIPELLIGLCKRLNLKLDPESLKRKYQKYSKSRDEANSKVYQEIECVKAALKAVDTSIRNSINFVDNNVLPQMNATEQLLENYELKSTKIKEQYEMLLKAEQEVATQITELSNKKSEQMTQIAQNICTNSQIEEIDRKITALTEREHEKRKDLKKVQAEVDELQKSTEQVMHNTKENIEKVKTELEMCKAKLNPTVKVTESDKERLKTLNTRIKEQEKTISLYKTQMEDTIQSLGHALKSHNPSQSHLLASTMQKILEKSTSIHSINKKSLATATLPCSHNQSIFTLEEDEPVKEEGSELPFQGTRRMQKTETPSRHAPPYEIAECDSPVVPEVVDPYATSDEWRRQMSKSVVGMKKMVRTQTEVDGRWLLPGNTMKTIGKTSRAENAHSVLRTVGAIRENERYKRCISTGKCGGSRSRIRTTRITSMAKKIEGASELWQEVWKRYSSSFTQNEIEIFNMLEPLLTGTLIYKKFNTQYSAKLPLFDPLNATEYPPDRCGYGLRYVAINLNFKHMIVKQSKDGGSNYKISLDTIQKPVIPQQTIEIIRMQQSVTLQENLSMSTLELQEDLNESRGMLQKIAVTLADKKAGKGFKEKCAECGYYPFYFELIDGGKLELVATEYAVLKAWVMGVNAMANHKTVVEKFRVLIDSILNGVADNYF